VTALDGLRGFALIGMLAWHAELEWVRGGFARMTIFFVLSGYLATRSWGRRREEGFRSFWVRRTLRLLPMTLVGVVVGIGVTLAVGSDTTRASLGGDVVSVLTYTSNWHFLDTDQSYGALFERQSAFQHYWSLSIEEQLFLLLPVLLAAAAAVARWVRRPQWAVLAAAAVVVAAGALVAGPSPDGIYFGTQTRLLEFLVGASLAVSVVSWSGRSTGTRSTLCWLGRLAGLVVVATLAFVDRGSDWLYEGGIYLFALPVIAVVAAVELGDPWLRGVLEIRPLVWLGRAALSIYVLHWPLFVLVEDVVPHGTSEAVEASVKVLLGIVVGGVAHHLVEQPMLDDTRRRLRERRPVLGPRLVPMVGVAGAMAVLAVAAPVPEARYDFEEAVVAFERSGVDQAALPGGAPPPREGADRGAEGSTNAADGTASSPHRAAVFGSSTALMNGLGLDGWADVEERIDVEPGDARLGCGLLQSGERPQSLDSSGTPEWFPVEDDCVGWPADWREKAATSDVDVAIVFFGVWEIADWRTDAGELTSIEDRAFRENLRRALDEGIDQLLAGGVVHVVLMTSPVIGGGTDDGLAAARALPPDHDRRTDLFNDLLRRRAAERPEVSVFDYAGVIERLGGDFGRLVPDGVHPTWEGATEIWNGAAGSALLDHLDAVDR
jgi:peptidoglycan/LPS O-acetylase OafA/YrhL